MDVVTLRGTILVASVSVGEAKVVCTGGTRVVTEQLELRIVK